MPPESWCTGLPLEAVEPDEAEVARRHLAAPAAAVALQLEPEGDVVEHVEPGHQRVLLEDDAAVAAGAGHGPPVQQHAPGRRPDEAGHDVEQRGLAASRGAERHDELARPDRQRHVGQRPDRPGPAVDHLDAPQLHARAVAPWRRAGAGRGGRLGRGRHRQAPTSRA
jgi:hypothetical protein